MTSDPVVSCGTMFERHKKKTTKLKLVWLSLSSFLFYKAFKLEPKNGLGNKVCKKQAQFCLHVGSFLDKTHGGRHLVLIRFEGVQGKQGSGLVVNIKAAKDSPLAGSANQAQLIQYIDWLTRNTLF